MRLLLLILGVLATVIGIEQRAQAEQSYPWCINKPDTPPQCRYGRSAWQRRVLFTQSLPIRAAVN